VTFFSYSQQDSVNYTKILTERAQKIVNALDLENQAVYRKVITILVDQYKSLGIIHDNLEAGVKAINADTSVNKSQAEHLINNLKLQADQKLYNLHCGFLGKLSAELTPEQIVKIKDGMTYGIVKGTYDSYCNMIPSLKEEEKKQLMAWLVEAREHAIDASSSEKKHEWFGKYKGRFNNYLSKQGYDIRKERKNWEERIKIAE
jgi:hypothetical protein